MLFLKHRLTKNTPEGYYIFCDNEEAIYKGSTKVCNLDDISAIMMMSDGYAQVIDVFHIFNDEDIFQNIQNIKDAKQVYQNLTNMQLDDKDCNNFNRFKISDDASLIYRNFINKM